MSYEMAEPSYRCEMGNGLVKRWSTEQDTHNIAAFFSSIFQHIFTDWSKQELMEYVYQHMHANSFVGGPGEVALIEDLHKSGNPVVAIFALWRYAWQYEDMTLPIGRPEWCGTDPAYRGQSFPRLLFEMIHARSQARGDVAQAFTGLPNRWRHYGYEYGLELSGRRSVHLSRIPRQPEQMVAPYSLRPATRADIPVIEKLYQQRRQDVLIRTLIPDAYWRYYIEGVPGGTGCPPRMNIQMIVDSADDACGYLLLTTTRRSQDMLVFSLEVAPETDWYRLAFPLLRALERYGAALPVNRPEQVPFSEISFYLGREHPLFTVLGSDVLSAYTLEHAWYVRVADIALFIQHILPVLERRLSSSLFARYTGELHLNFYRQGLCMTVERGHIVGVEQERPLVSFHPVSACFPAEVFWKLLFGYRNLAELCHMYPDIFVTNTARVLVDTLFPCRPSWALLLS